jgi:L-ascorbate metabolism protein UlaG (beta-lactamase superfamily)
MVEIAYKGANCVTIQTKQLLVTDPKIDGEIASNKILGKARVQMATHRRLMVPPAADSDQLVLDGPGEYEVGDMSIKGVGAQAHLEADGLTATMYRIKLDDETTIAVIGHVLGDNIKDEQLEELGLIDILILPVGGGGYTMDARGAASIVRRVDPKYVIPTHYQEDGVKYEVPQDSIDLFLKELGVEPQQEQTLKLKTRQLPENLTVIQLAKTA